MTINTTKLQFETVNDFVDYVAKGGIPSKKNYQSMREVLDHAEHILSSWGTKVDDTPSADILAEVLERVYLDRIHNRRITIGALIGIGVVALIGGAAAHERRTCDDDEPVKPGYHRFNF